jgi:two-component system OmpR family response regulator
LLIGEEMTIQDTFDPVGRDMRATNRSQGHQTPGRSVRVLVVDDEPLILDVLSTMLEDEGFDVIRAENAYQGFEIAREAQPDLVISDVMMPGATGIDLYAWLQQLDPMPQVVFMSAVSRRSPAPQVPLLEKPFDIEEMLELVDIVMARAS